MSNFSLTDVWSSPRNSRSIFEFIPYQRIRHFTQLCDFALILTASLAGGIFYHYLVFETDGDVFAYVTVGSYCGFVFVLIYSALGLYEPNRLLSAGAQIRGVMLVWATVLLFVTSLFFLFKTGANYSRGGTIGFGVVGFAMLLASRALIGTNLRRALSNGTLAGRRVVVIGDQAQLAAKSALDLLRAYGTREVGRFELSTNVGSDALASQNDIDMIDAGIRAARSSRAEQVLLAIGWADLQRRELVCKRLRVLPLPVLLLPDQAVTATLSQGDGSIYPLSAIEIQRAPLAPRDLMLKRIFDVIFASLGLVLLSPLLLLTALAIKLDSAGPVIFRQRRKGFNGREFSIYKFRTMSVLEDGPCIKQAQRDDCRVTRLGRLLRVSSIDELPQLINVLVGEMSLVGPRPHAVAHDDEYSDAIEHYAFRHHVKPGITGWAQTHGFRGETADLDTMCRRIKLDLWYIDHWSLWLDIRIVALTCVELLRARNAY